MSRHTVKTPTVMNVLGISHDTQRLVRSSARGDSRANVIAPKLVSDLFSWHADTRTFIAELSTLQANGGRLGQLWNDACDEGFTIISTRTGEESDFVCDRDDRDAEGEGEGEGELQGVYYVPTRETVHRLPQLDGVSVLIIND